MKTLFFLFLPVYISAQQVTLRGVVAVFNSRFETGKTEYVANAQVEETFGRANATITSSDGTFSLVLVGVKERSSFGFSVQKPKYEVVNADQLRAVAGQRDAVRIFLAPAGRISENKRKYYQIGKTNSEIALSKKIAAKQKEAQALHDDQAANREAIRQLEKEIADLYERYNSIDQNARNLAEQFSRVNLDDATELYQRAFRQFQNGSIDSALIVLDEVNWEARVDSILAEEARLFALKNVIDFNDSVLTLRRDSIAGAIWVKIQSHVGLHQFQEALHTGEWLPQLFAKDSSKLADAYAKVSWLALLAQEYSLAKLYAETGIGLNAEQDYILNRYIGFALCFGGNNEQSRAKFKKLQAEQPDPMVFKQVAQNDCLLLQKLGVPAENIALLVQCLE